MWKLGVTEFGITSCFGPRSMVTRFFSQELGFLPRIREISGHSFPFAWNAKKLAALNQMGRQTLFSRSAPHLKTSRSARESTHAVNAFFQGLNMIPRQLQSVVEFVQAVQGRCGRQMMQGHGIALKFDNLVTLLFFRRS